MNLVDYNIQFPTTILSQSKEPHSSHHLRYILEWSLSGHCMLALMTPQVTSKRWLKKLCLFKVIYLPFDTETVYPYCYSYWILQCLFMLLSFQFIVTTPNSYCNPDLRLCIFLFIIDSVSLTSFIFCFSYAIEQLISRYSHKYCYEQMTGCY